LCDIALISQYLLSKNSFLSLQDLTQAVVNNSNNYPRPKQIEGSEHEKVQKILYRACKK